MVRWALFSCGRAAGAGSCCLDLAERPGSFPLEAEMLDWADDAREQTDTRIMDVLQTPCLRRPNRSPCPQSVVCFLSIALSVATELGEKGGPE